MSDKPDTNPNEKKEEIPHPDGFSVGRDYIVVQGSLDTGSVAGSGSVSAQNIARGNITNNVGKSAEDKAKFADLMVELRDLIVEAHRSGELPEPVARKAVENLKETAELIKKAEKPPKNQILSKLQYVADILEAAVDMLSASSGPMSILLKAMPIAALLIKLASRIF